MGLGPVEILILLVPLAFVVTLIVGLLVVVKRLTR